MAEKGNVKEQTRSRVRIPTAVALMMSVHKGNYAVAGVYPRDLAQTKAAEAVRWAREEGYPLKVEAVRQ